MSGTVEIPWPAISILLTVATFIYSAIATSQRAHRQRVAALERQVTQLQERSRHAPSRDALDGLNHLLRELTGEVRELRATTRSTDANVERLHERFNRYEEAIIREAS